MITINLLSRHSASRFKPKLTWLQTGITSLGLALSMLCILHAALALGLMRENARAEHWLTKLASLASLSTPVKTWDKRRLQWEVSTTLLQHIKNCQLANIALLDTIFRLTPKDLRFLEMTRMQDRIAFKGLAETVSAISLLTTSLNVAPHLQKAQLVEIKNVNETTQLAFQLQVMQDADSIQNN